VFGWLFRTPATPAANHERIREEFARRFPTGGFSSLDFRPHFDGYGHNAWAEILPAATVEATRAAAYDKLAEIVEFLRPFQPLFGRGDRVQFAVGFPVAIKATGRRMFMGWVPAARLADVRPPDFAAVGGAFGENDVWHEGLWPTG
jgi:hypothetical protein